MDSNRKEVIEIIEYIVKLYANMYPKLCQIPLSIEITKDLDARHCEIRPEYADIISQKNQHSDDNGRTVVSRKVGETIYILLNEDKMKEYIINQNATWIGTVAHELTHALDYHQMAKLEGLEYYDKLEKDDYLFISWSEYHAKKNGYSFLRLMLGKMNLLKEDNEEIEKIINIEWPHCIKDFFVDYHKNLNDGLYQIYLTMHILGRYSVWNDLYPEYFNESRLADDFCNTPWMGRLYSFMHKHEDLESIYPCFEEFRAVLSENWPVGKE